MKNTRQCEPQTRTSVIQFEDVTTKIGVDSLFSRSLLGTITLEPLALPPETGGQTAAAATLFLLPFLCGAMPGTGEKPSQDIRHLDT